MTNLNSIASFEDSDRNGSLNGDSGALEAVAIAENQELIEPTDEPGTPNSSEPNDSLQPAPQGASSTRIIGKVASPPQKESTSDKFHFWVKRGELVEKTQIVRAVSRTGSQEIQFFALVEEVYRQSRKSSIGEEYDTFDGDVDYEPEFRAEGVTFATAQILRTQPSILTPPMEQSSVFLGDDQDACLAYRADEIENPLAIGLIKNGGEAIAGPGYIDLDYLLGQNGGHMNVNGMAGRATKSSFLMFTIYQLLQEARRRQVESPSAPDPLMIVPIILNVKGFDLFHINRLSTRYSQDAHGADWQALGVEQPRPFGNPRFYAPQVPNGTTAVTTGCLSDVCAYSWSLRNIIEQGLFLYLFNDDDSSNDNFRALVLDLEAKLTIDQINNDGTVTRRFNSDLSLLEETFQGLLEWLEDENNYTTHFNAHHRATWQKLRRRLLTLVIEGNGVLRRNDQDGNPLDVGIRQTVDPIVIDIDSLSRVPALQRFVVATIFQKLIEERTGQNATRGLVYLVALDELNFFAPRGSKDAITQLIEMVAAKMRSRGIILLGAQQQASKVSEIVIENSSIRVLGRSGSLELSQPIWKSLSQSAKRKATELAPDEKMIFQGNEPMYVRVPNPPWAMNPREVVINSPTSNGAFAGFSDADTDDEDCTY
jgi:hypothetical protein